MKKLNKKKLFYVIVVLFVLTVIGFVVLSNILKEKPIGGETDEHGCVLMAGYTWCEAKQKCLRTWEEPCEEPVITEDKAREIAQASTCMDEGTLKETEVYNPSTQTWWIDLEPYDEKEYCDNPACVVDENTETAEINWRCTGALPPE